MKESYSLEVRPRVLLRSALILAVVAIAAYFLGSRGFGPRADGNAVASYLSEHPEEVEKIVANYLRKNPQILGEMISGLLGKNAPTASADTQASGSGTVASHAAEIFASKHQVTLGNPQGDVTLVEFLDYNCGYCKRAFADMVQLLDSDPKLKIIIKEYPVLGQGSVEAARVAIALRMQDPEAKKYLTFHRAMMEAHAPADEQTALKAAEAAGADMNRLSSDVKNQEVSDTLQETQQLGADLNIGGTPSYVIGHDVLAGAVGVDALKERIQIARQ